MDRQSVLTMISATARALPRVKGLGIPLEQLSKLFSDWDVEIVARVNGSLMRLSPANGMERHRLFTPKYHDRHEHAFMRQILRPGDVVVDVGANMGSYTLLAAQLVGPQGKVVAIEADPVNAARLRENVRLNDYRNVSIEEVGVSGKFETLTLHLHDDNLGAHSFAVDHGQGGRSINCVPLAALADKCRLMKIDIEGYELKVLKPYLDLGHRPEFILIEHSHVDPTPLLEGSGYRLERRLDGNSIYQSI